MMQATRIAALMAAFIGAASAIERGTLVIAGGAVSADSADIFQAFITHMPPGADRIAIIPAASGVPAESAAAFIEALGRYGVAADRIDIIALAVEDDPSTDAIDESTWKGNAANPAEIARIERAGAIWFTGGDQARITAALLNADGSDTAMLTAVRARLAAGAVVGGTSAGAAIMSPTMIARGDSLTALTEPVATSSDTSRMDGGALVLAKGLGFLPGAVTDQHFDRKARLGRLARALTLAPKDQRIGFGVDENTALVVDLDARRASVAGEGSVTVLDARSVRATGEATPFAAEGFTVSVFNAGDTLDMATLSLTPAPFKVTTRGKEYYDHTPIDGGGMAVPNPMLEEALGVDLVDNSVATSLTRVSFTQAGAGVSYIFAETPESTGWQGAAPDGRTRYTISSVRFAIAPVDVKITPAR
jgi:cyanophycinase